MVVTIGDNVRNEGQRPHQMRTSTLMLVMKKFSTSMASFGKELIKLITLDIIRLRLLLRTRWLHEWRKSKETHVDIDKRLGKWWKFHYHCSQPSWEVILCLFFDDAHDDNIVRFRQSLCVSSSMSVLEVLPKFQSTLWTTLLVSLWWLSKLIRQDL